MKEARGTCWVGYQQIGMKKKNGKMVPNCVKEDVEIYYEENGKGYGYTFEFITDKSLQEAEYQGRKVKLNKIMQGDAKKFKVYVKNPKGFSQKAHCAGRTKRETIMNLKSLVKETIKEVVVERQINLFVEKNSPTNPSKWAYYKSQAKKKFDVYPSAHANAWAAKKYKAAGGGWKKG